MVINKILIGRYQSYLLSDSEVCDSITWYRIAENLFTNNILQEYIKFVAQSCPE